MKKGCFSLLLLLLLCPTLFAGSNDKGFCPPPSPISKADRAQPAPTPNQPPPEADAKFGAVSLLLVISDKGYVCSVQLIRGFDKEADTRAMQGARQWRFDPSEKHGHPVAVEMRVEVGFWRKANGELILASPDKPTK
jgi:hypothetical protein